MPQNIIKYFLYYDLMTCIKRLNYLKSRFISSLFWSIIFYVLEIRQHSSGFLGIATETAFGWVVFTIILLFAIFVAGSHRQTKNETKDKNNQKCD